MHGATIYEDCVFLEVQKNEDDEYVLLRSMKMDDPPLRKITDAMKNFIIWPTEFPRHATMHT